MELNPRASWALMNRIEKNTEVTFPPIPSTNDSTLPSNLPKKPILKIKTLLPSSSPNSPPIIISIPIESNIPLETPPKKTKHIVNEITDVKFNSFPTPPVQHQPPITPPKFGFSQTSTGCCVYEKHIWDQETLKPISEYSFMDGIEERNCSAQGENHFTGEMCYDVQAKMNKEKENNDAMVFPIKNVIQKRNKMRALVPESNSLFNAISGSSVGDEMNRASLQRANRELLMPEANDVVVQSV